MLVERIRSGYAQMSAVEKRIADVILEDPVQATNSTLAHLAARAGVSEGSVINFAGRLGVGGFSALKIALARETHTGFSFGGVTEEDTPLSAFRKTAGNTADAVQRTARAIQNGPLEQAAALLASARRTDIFGAGDSALIAQDAYFHFMRAGLPAYAITDYLTFSIDAAQLDENCVALAVSHSGQTAEIVDAMELAKRRGAATICVTSYGDSRLARLCQAALVTASSEAERRQEAVAARLTHMMVLDALCAYLSARRGSRAVEREDAAEQYLSRRRYPRQNGGERG